MDRLLLFEYLHADAVEFQHASYGMRSEARLMLEALLEDAVMLDDARISVVLCDAAVDTLGALPDNVELHRCHDRDTVFDVLAAAAQEADFVLPVAPEGDRLLLTAAQTLQPLICKTLLPPLATLEQCSDKMLTWNTFASDAIPMLQCEAVGIEAFNDRNNDQSLIFKPRYGAGCDGIQRGNLPRKSDPSGYIQQPWVDGQSFSVGVLSGTSGFWICPVAGQDVIWRDSQPVYRGGTIPADITKDIAEQIITITEQVMLQTGCFSGYLGLDFMVASTDNAVYLNEINSRLCTSYVGYRQLLETNPLEVLLGRTSDVTWQDKSKTIAFEVGTSFR